MTDDRPARPWLRTVVLLLVALVVVGGVAGSIAWAFSTTFASPDDDKYSHFHQRTYTVVGQIQSEVGAAWTVEGPEGRMLTITITPSTVFGTSAAVEKQSDFAVGDTIVARGTAGHGAINATTIAEHAP